MVSAEKRVGRPATTSHDEISEAALRLFERKGYAATSVADIAAEVGIARRTFFSYFSSKSDAFWWGDEKDLHDVEHQLASGPSDDIHPLQQIIELALLSSRRTSPSRDDARAYFLMIERNPELQIGALRFQRRWSELIAEHLRRRVGETRSDLLPEVVAAALLSIGTVVVERWMQTDGDVSLATLLNDNLGLLRAAFEESVAGEILS